MPAPALVGPNIYAAGGTYLRDAYRRVYERLGGDEKLEEWAGRNDENYYRFQQINARLQPKDVQVSLDNSAESLLLAFEAQQRGEIVQFIEDEKPKIEAENAEFVELPKPAGAIAWRKPKTVIVAQV